MYILLLVRMMKVALFSHSMLIKDVEIHLDPRYAIDMTTQFANTSHSIIFMIISGKYEKKHILLYL